ncbi:MAG: hypothetical protein HY749_07605 [Gammaproteobacteria bacterium]|nr:hypothetical protein [Gammaproteobacteria bacterium]
MSEHSQLLSRLADVDTLSYRVYAHTTVPQDDVRITVAVAALVSIADSDQQDLYRRIRETLANFIKADWALSQIIRTADAMGYEHIDLSASARVPPEENYNLQERARRASREGLALTNPNADYTVRADRVSSAVQTLREQTLREVRQHIEGFNRVSERRWRLGHIAFGAESELAEAMRRTSKGAYTGGIPDYVLRSEGDTELTGAERIVLVTEVVLKAGAGE